MNRRVTQSIDNMNFNSAKLNVKLCENLRDMLFFYFFVNLTMGTDLPVYRNGNPTDFKGFVFLTMNFHLTFVIRIFTACRRHLHIRYYFCLAFYSPIKVCFFNIINILNHRDSITQQITALLKVGFYLKLSEDFVFLMLNKRL